MKKVLKVIGIVVLAVIVLIAVLLFWLSKRPSVPEKYTEQVPTGGGLETMYLAMGTHEVSYFESATRPTLTWSGRFMLWCSSTDPG